MTQTTTQQQKKAVRQKIKQLQQKMSPAKIKETSQKISKQLKNIVQFHQAKSLFIYLAAEDEVQTLPLIKNLLAHNKIVTVPKIFDQQTIAPVRIKDTAALTKNKFGILEPDSEEKYSGTIETALVPGLAFTPAGDRLGRGNGYYDRYLAQNPDIFTIGLAFEEQILPELPSTANDQKIDMVLTESQIYS